MDKARAFEERGMYVCPLQTLASKLQAFRILNDLGRDRPSHLNLFELRRRPSWRGAPVFLMNDEYSELGAPTKSSVVVSSVGISSVISPIVAFH